MVNQTTSKTTNNGSYFAKWWVYAIFSVLILITFFFDNSLLRQGVGFRFNWLDGLMLYLTDFGMLFFTVVLATSSILKKKYRWLAMLSLSLAMSFEITYLLKLIFQTPRPYFSLEIAIIPLTQAAGYAFPSLHSAFCIGIIPFLSKIYDRKWKIITGILIATTIALSRAYLGVHYFSDILVGGLIGFSFSSILIYVEDKYGFTSWFLGHVKNKLELRRQIAHLVIGMTLVLLIDLRLMTTGLLLIILILGVIISLIYKIKPIPGIREILFYLERPKDIELLPGKGPIFLVLGALLTMLIFPVDIAKGAIAILAVGDSISHVIGRYFGRTKVPFSKDKMLEGTIVAIGFSVLTALLFVDFPKAFLASLVTVSFEAVYPEKIAHIFDDNLVIPLMAGAIMMMM